MRGYPGPKLNEVATTDPGATDDISGGWEKFSVWVNTTTGDLWMCRSNARAAAVWDQINFNTNDVRFLTVTKWDSEASTITPTPKPRAINAMMWENGFPSVTPAPQPTFLSSAKWDID